MMDYPINNSNLSDSGNLNINYSSWSDIFTSFPTDIYGNVGPVYTGCNLDIARNFSEEDLRALEYEIPDEYMHQCLENDYFLIENGSVSDGKHGISAAEINKVSTQSNSSYEEEKKFIYDEQNFESFLVKESQDSTKQMQKTGSYAWKERELLSANKIYHKHALLNAGKEQELLSQTFRRRCTASKQSPLIEINNFINKDHFSSKTVDTFVKRNEIVELNTNISREKSLKCSDNKTRLSKTKRKPRTRLTASQLFYLNKAFAANHYLTSEMRKILSKSLSISEICLKTWFQNQRARSKRRMNLNNTNNLNSIEASGNFSTQSDFLFKQTVDNRYQIKTFEQSGDVNQQSLNKSFNHNSSDWHSMDPMFSNEDIFLDFDSIL